MHILTRQVRFSIAPFLSDQPTGFNSYASKPAGGDGLSVFLALWVDLEGPVEQQTGFVVNVSTIDKAVRQHAVPVFTRSVQDAFRHCRTLKLEELAGLLKQVWKPIQEVFAAQILRQLRLDLNPYRYLAVQAEDADMLIYSEKFEFSSMHKLWNEAFDAQSNFEHFGKCANPAGHGHNYILEVRVRKKIPQAEQDWFCDFQKVVAEEFLDLVDHKNLNADVPEFKSLNPTVENLAFLAWEKLEGKFKNVTLCSITVWENDRTYCTYSR
ncbi:MAG: 6-carboxytetrahydropterin synthase [Phycisphaerae bacterium]|nr:6-carboxytetrahydropterin synthase [Phycisphaerae bacterium]